MLGTKVRMTLLAAYSSAAVGSAIAGDENVLVVRQESSPGSVSSNQMLVDQSGATNSLVIGPSDTLIGSPNLNNLVSQDSTDRVTLMSRAALQRGDNNSSSITISGSGGEIQLIQDGTVNLSGSVGGTGTPNDFGNVATVVSTGNDTLGAVLQLGDRNIANLNLSGDNARGLIAQSGLNNTADLTLGADASGQIIQNGNQNETILDVPSANNVTVTQNGNGLTVGQTAFQVFSTNPGTISITQTGF